MCTEWSYQSCSAGLAADGGGGGAERADGGGARASLQGGLPPWALSLGGCGAREADTHYLVGRSKQAIPGHALKIPERKARKIHIFFTGYLWLCEDISYTCVIYHLVPATAPSFLPSGSSSSTPHHAPLAKSVSPRNFTTPALLPPTYKKKKKKPMICSAFLIY